jgi:hypothetical protein
MYFKHVPQSSCVLNLVPSVLMMLGGDGTFNWTAMEVLKLLELLPSGGTPVRPCYSGGNKKPIPAPPPFPDPASLCDTHSLSYPAAS